MHYFLLLLCSLGLAQHPNEAEKLFRAAEKKINDAETLHVDFSGSLVSPRGNLELKGGFQIANGNKSYLRVEGLLDKRPFRLIAISNEARQRIEIGPPRDISVTQELPKAYLTNLIALPTRSGFLPYVVEGGAGGTKGKEVTRIRFLTDDVAVSDFVLGKKEKLGDRDAQVIQYQKVIPRGGGKVMVHLWLDSATSLPLKRSISMTDKAEPFQIVEAYDIRINGKVDTSKFEIPK